MLVSQTDFVAAFPEFSNATDFPPAVYNFWEAEAEAQLNADRFGARLNTAIMLFVAHNLILQAQAQRTATAGGLPGITQGPVSSKSVGGASISYDMGSVSVSGAENYNLTTYGQRLWRMIRAYGGGPVYVPGFPRRLPF